MLIKVLKCIGSTEESTFNEICQGLGDDCPQDSSEWSSLFRILSGAEREGLVEIDRAATKINSAILTEAGAAMVKAAGN